MEEGGKAVQIGKKKNGRRNKGEEGKNAMYSTTTTNPTINPAV